MASTFPGSADNIQNDVANGTAELDLHPNLHNKLADAVNAVETALLPGGTMNLAAHVAAADPHSVYLTQTEGDARYSTIASGVPDGSITSAKIADGTIQAVDMAAGTAATNVGTLGGSLSGTLPSPTLAANSVGASQITDGTVGTAELADGAVTSAKILDGTIQTADLAANAITQAVGSQAFGAFSGNTGSTTSPTFVDVAAPSSITMTMRNGYGLLLVVSGAVSLTSAAGIATLGIKVDGAAPALVKRVAPLVANTATPVLLLGMLGSNSGSHTFQLAWSVSAGTLAMDGSSSMVMYAIEFLR